MPEESLQPKTKEILIQNKSSKAQNVFCETFAYQPQNVEELRLGSLFFIGRLENVRQDISHIINLITSTIKREYYSDPKRKSLKSFEDSLKKANSVLSDLSKNGKIDWLNKFSFVCIAVANNILHLTQVGNTNILLLRESRLTDIGKKLVPSQEKADPQKVFQSVASGKLFYNDRIILSASDIFQDISFKGFKQIIERNQINQLEKILSDKNKYSSQGLILIEMEREDKAFAQKFDTVTLSPALQTAYSQPQKNYVYSAKAKNITSEIGLVVKSYLFKSKDWLRLTAEKLGNLLGQYKSKSPTARNRISIEAKQDILSSEQLLPEQTLILPENIQKAPRESPRIFRDIERVEDKPPAADVEQTQPPSPSLAAPRHCEPPEAVKQSRGILSYPKKLSFLLRSLVSYFLSLSKFIPTNRADKKIYLGNEKPILRKKTIAIASLFILAASTAAGYLYYQKYQNQIIISNEAISQTEEKLNQINKINILSSPNAFADFSNNSFKPENLTIAKDSIIALSSGSNQVNLISIKDGSSKFMQTSLPQDKQWQKIEVHKQDFLILLDKDNTFYQYDLVNDKFIPLNLKLPFEEYQIKDFDIYNNFLYLLDAVNNQIIKCANLTTCSTWLSQAADNPIEALAIDGSIYTYEPDGHISVYYAGAKKGSYTTDIKPPASSVIKMITSADFKNIYLLDIKAKRIIIIDKTGQLLKQITSDTFKNLQDMVISEDEKNFFVADEDKIYKIENE